ncbi:flagellar hook-associated protein FlgK [Sporosarcina gallistercoris]|uniref:Flagellar hook-associated protein 1 n=1 Tax=Sporosarcina gallistercoris TaxID=2762245 RepID=A0ABR8PN36_9BACL|nr:flagellar hook-associated protein FlgK [Sporosarcina gallistercoris]MBD7909602.1 flagellar hook-associated protein FlgK [Sporosarcina gallistercoris]
MGSTFMGLETSKRGLQTQQSALYTTGHNISNANTLGYSRQRVNMEATGGFPGVGLNAGTMPGFLGTGVQAGSIQRIRDSFVDQQYRGESNKLGYWDTRSKAIGQLEDIMNEPSEYGLQKSLSQFWSSLEDLAVHPENGGARKVVIERGIAVADSFNYMNKSLEELKTNTGQEIGISTKEINSIMSQIAGLNEQISSIEPNGYLPNDLYDARDVLVDKLAQFLPIETSYTKSGGNASAVAEGSMTISIKLEGNPTPEPLIIVSGKDATEMTLDGANADGYPSGPISGFSFSANGQVVGGSMAASAMKDTGSLKSLVNSYGSTGKTGLIPDMIAKLDKMANAFMKAFNDQHKAGYTLNGTGTDPDGDKIPFFTGEGTGAKGIKVSEAIIDDPSLVSASSKPGEEGNGENAKLLGKVQFDDKVGLDGATIQTYFQGVIGQLGVDGQQAEKMKFNSETLMISVSNRRDSISAVSLDEEMTNMIQFQQAYNASARMVTVVDETLDKIINGMGVVGR